MMLEGAPHLKPEHLPIFDCANKCGKKGVRYISWTAHIDMMAAAQPFISGAISKTINMPHAQRWTTSKTSTCSPGRKMTKAIALYRDGSKLSQPCALSSRRFSRFDARRIRRCSPIMKEGQGTGTSGLVPSPSSRGNEEAFRCPAKRFGYTQKAKIGGHSIFLRTGQYEDGTLGEIFLDMHKEGAAFRPCSTASPSRFPSACSTACPWTSTSTPSRSRGSSPTAWSGHDHIKMATSVLDYIFRDLAIAYLERHELGQVKPEDLDSTSAQEPRSPNGVAGHRTAATYAGAAPAHRPPGRGQGRAYGSLRTANPRPASRPRAKGVA